MDRSGDDDTHYDNSPRSGSKSSVVESSVILQNSGRDLSDPVYRSVALDHRADRSFFAVPSHPQSGPTHGKGLGSMMGLSDGLDAPPGAFLPNKFAPSKPIHRPIATQITQPESKPWVLAPPTAMELEQDSFNKDAEVPPLPACYSYNTSVISKADRDTILEGLRLSLSKMSDLQYEVKTRNYKVRGTLFIDESMATFMIHLFQTGANHARPNCILIEFQKREGDGIVFQKFFRGVVEDMKSKDLVHYGGHPADTSLPNVLPLLMSEEYGELDFSQDQALPGNLLKMCGSVYLEPRREATGVLARGSRNPSNVGLIAALGVSILSTLCNLLKNCHDLQIIRNSAVVLNNMFKHDANTRVQSHKAKMFQDLCATFLKWSGAEEINQVTSSTLVCRELCSAIEKLVQDRDMMTQNVQRNGLAVKSLQKIATKSPHQELNLSAKRLLEMITA